MIKRIFFFCWISAFWLISPALPFNYPLYAQDKTNSQNQISNSNNMQHPIISQDSIRITFADDPASFLAEATDQYLKWFVNIIVFVLLIMFLFLFGYTFKGIKRTNLADSMDTQSEPLLKELGRIIAKQEIVPGRPQRGTHLQEAISGEISRLESEIVTNAPLRANKERLLKLYQIILKNLVHCEWYGDYADLPKLLEEDLDRITFDFNPYSKKVFLISLISPTLGFLGTILGLMHISSGFAVGQLAAELAVLPGIRYALYTTMLGLVLMILATVVDQFFENKEDKFKKTVLTLLGKMYSYLFLANKIGSS